MFLCVLLYNYQLKDKERMVVEMRDCQGIENGVVVFMNRVVE